MQSCGKCGQSYEGEKCPSCGASAPESQRKPLIQVYALLPIAGLLGAILGMAKYSVLERTPIVVALFAVYIASLLPMIIFVRRGHQPTHVAVIRSACRWGGGVLIAMALVLFANGALDRSPPKQIFASIVDKRISRATRGPSYSVTITPSWRLGETEADLSVTADTFAILSTGGRVSIDVHPGFFHLSWYDDIEPR
jgi:hypothetical protein